VADVRQFAHVRVGDVLGDVLRRVGEEGAERALLASQDQHRRGDTSEHVGVGVRGPS